MSKRKQLLMLVIDAENDFNRDALKKKLDLAIDWIEVTATTWLLWTSSSPSKWMERLRRILAGTATFVVVEVNAGNRAGVMHGQVATFLQEKYARQGSSADS